MVFILARTAWISLLRDSLAQIEEAGPLVGHMAVATASGHNFVESGHSDTL